MTRISPAEWARSCGFSRQYAHQLIKQGIVPIVNGKVDLQEADQALTARRDLAKVYLKGQSRDRQHSSHDHRNLKTLLQICRIKNLEERNKLLSIKCKIKAEGLVKAEKVRAEAFLRKRRLEDAILSIPERLASQLAFTDAQAIHAMLTKEICRIFEPELEALTSLSSVSVKSASDIYNTPF